MIVTTVRHRDSSARLSTIVALEFFFIGVFISVLVLAVSGVPVHPSGWLWLSVVGSVMVGISGCRLARRRIQKLGEPRWLRFGPLFTLYYTMVFGVFSLAWLRPQVNGSLIETSQIPLAVAICTLGLACWVIGYLVGAPDPVQRAANSLIDRVFPKTNWAFRFPSVPVAIYLVGVAARLYQIHLNIFGDFNPIGGTPSGFAQLTSMIAEFAPFGLIMAMLDAFVVSKSFRSRSILAAMLLTEIATGLFAAQKGVIIESLVSIGIVAVFVLGRISRKAIIVSILAVLISYPMVTAYRSVIRSETTSPITKSQAAASLVPEVVKVFSSLTPRSIFINTPASIVGRLREIDNVAIIRQKTPSEYPYLPWDNLIIGPAIDWIPRLIWVSKPVLSGGVAFSVQYYDQPPNTTSSSAVTIPGDLYRHGGAAPLCLGMFILGVLSSIFEFAVDPRRDFRRLILFVPLLFTFSLSENDFTTTLLGVLAIFIAAMMASFIAFQPQNHFQHGQTF